MSTRHLMPRQYDFGIGLSLGIIGVPCRTPCVASLEYSESDSLYVTVSKCFHGKGGCLVLKLMAPDLGLGLLLGFIDEV
ncbi:MAG: hypothetical protein WED04_08660 [Promethearchaeati archaeon SRVP18_Atabeyarchaeia-1]